MIPVSSAFKEAMKRPVKELDAYIRIDANNSITSADDLISIKISCDSSMCKAAMRKLEAKYTGEHNLLGQWVHVGFGVKLPSTGTFDYLDYGSFLITEIKTSKDTDVTEIVAYDKMINAMTKYEELQTTYPQGLFVYTQLLCQACNLTLGNESFAANNNWQVTEELWKNISGVTYRDIFQQIAQVTGTTCIISNDDKIYFKTINATGETLTYDNLFKLKLEPIYGEINSVVLSREPITGEDVYMKDDTSILQNGLTEFKIDSNQIVDKRREDAITPIYNALHGISYYPFEASTEGLGWYEIGDNFDIINDTNDTFNTTLFNFSITVDGGIKETLKTSAETKTQTQYEYASKISKRLSNTEVTVNKQEETITALVDTTDNLQKEINPTSTSSGSSIYLEDSAEAELIDFEIEGKTTQETRQGYNLLAEIGNGSSNSSVSNGNITFNFSVNQDTYRFVSFKKEVGKTYTLSFDGSGLASGESIKFTLDGSGTGNYSFKNGKNIWIITSNRDNGRFTIDDVSRDNITSTITLSNIMILEGSYTEQTLPPYEPYGVSPSPDYPSELVSVGTYNSETGKYGIEVKTNGKNFLNIQDSDNTINNLNIVSSNQKITINGTATSGTYTWVLITQNGTIVRSGTPSASIIKSLANGTYFSKGVVSKSLKALSGTSSYNIQVNLYDENGNNANTTTSNTKVSAIGLYLGNAQTYTNYKFGLQLEEGTQATTYEEYKSSTYLYTLDNPLRSIGDTKDLLYIKNGMLYVERKIGKVVLDGSEDWAITSSTSSRTVLYTPIDDIEDYISSNDMPNLKSNYFNAVTQQATWKNGDISRNTVSKNVFLTMINGYTVSSFKSWLSTHNTEVQYILAEPYTEELGQVEMPSTYKGITYLNTTDELEPNMNITYVRDTIIANYVESHVSELKITEKSIESRVQTIEESDYGSRINAVEERTTDTEKSIEVISTNIDTTTGEVRKVTTTNGMTFDENGLNIHTNQSTFNAQHTYEGTYYRDGDEVITETTINGFKATNLKNKGQHEYSYDDTNDLYEFIDERVEVDGEYCYATFYNGEE